MPAAAATRLKREGCPRTKHDSVFSPWKVLVGPSDWEDHAAGKEGVHRYRIRNLPDNFPGLYELGVAGASDEGLRARRRDLRGVMVVYLGQADNVRARLQQYGRTGSHLGTGNSAGKDEVSTLPTGPGLFKEVFARGYSVVFRCALMDNKQVAEKTEAELLRVFDYAWNKLQNGACRREEILLKLEQRGVSPTLSLVSRVHHMKQKIFGEKAGIKINGSGSIDTPSGIMRSILPRVRTFVRFRPHSVNSDVGGGDAIDVPWNRTDSEPHGKRPKGYIVKKINVAKRRTVPIHYSNNVCGVVLEDGSSCLTEPVQGRKRCTLHKGRRVKGNSTCSSSSYPSQVEVPNTELAPGLTENLKNSNQSQDEPSGRVWFELIKAQNKLVSTHPLRGPGCQTRVADDVAPIREMTVTGDSFSRSSGWPCTCGTRTSDGSPCMNKPVEGRKRCASHKGQRASSPDTIG